MDPVTCYGRNDSVDQGIDHGFQIEHQKTDPVHKDIDNSCHLADTEIAKLLCKIKAKDVLAAAGTAAAQYQPGSKSGHQTSDDTGSQTVIDERAFRNRDKSKGCGFYNDGDNGTEKESASHFAPRQIQKRQVYDKINDTCDIGLAERKMQSRS